MDNFPIPQNQEHSMQSNPQPVTAPVPPKKSRSNLVALVGLAVLGILCAIICGPFLFNFVSSMPEELNAITVVLDEYMQGMANRDASRAFAVVAKTGEQPIPMSDIETLLRGNNYLLFKGYRELALTGFNLTQMGADKYAEVEGQVLYEGDFVGEFSGFVVKENGAWKIQQLKVNAPPDKFGQGQ